MCEDTNILSTRVSRIINISHNTILLTLKLDEDFEILKVPYFVYIYNDSKFMKKPYTPITMNGREISLIVKTYYGTGLSNYIYKKSLGDTLFISNAYYKQEYNRDHKNVLMLAGGTGITPMLQIINNDSDKSKFTIIFSNSSFSDIIINKNIISDDVDIYHVISNPEYPVSFDRSFYLVNEYNFFFGRLSEKIIKEIHEKKGITHFDYIYVCGPKEYLECVAGSKSPDKTQGRLTGMLKNLGYDSDSVYKF
ncbi:hypothetical protein P3W45_001408 [Vairimorpha bombi]|jgi:cytochrome-b5 reductase